MKCPRCGLLSPETALSCNCGYDFPSGTMREAYLRPMQRNQAPFAMLRGRGLLIRCLLAFIASGILVALIWPTWGRDKSLPLPTVMSGLLGYGILLLLLARVLSRAGVVLRVLLGPCPAWSTLGGYVLLAFPLVVVSIASFFILYLPLSYLLPQFVEWRFSTLQTQVVWTSGSRYILANWLNFLLFVLVAPLVEEFFFRGLLLTRWSLKWGFLSGMLASSAVFALLHVDIIGKLFFGYVMSVLYLQTRSLVVPMSVHIANNSIAWGLASIDVLLNRERGLQLTLTEFQSLWWVGLLTTGLVMPWVMRFTKHHGPMSGWQVPYLASQGNDQEAGRG